MPNNPMERFEVSPEMRAMGERSVEQARLAFENFMNAAQQTIGTIEGQAATARKGARGIGQRAMSLAERNILNSFDFAQKLMQAKDMNDVVRLQTEYAKAQMEGLTEQARDMGEELSRAGEGMRNGT